MNIKTEILKSYISECVYNQISDFEIDEEIITDTIAVDMLI